MLNVIKGSIASYAFVAGAAAGLSALATWQTPGYELQPARYDSANGWVVPPATRGGIAGNVSDPHVLRIGSVLRNRGTRRLAR